MRIIPFSRISEESFPQSTALTVGVFDGIHAGHKELLDKVLSIKKEKGVPAGVVTFSDGIFTMFKKGESPLQSIEERLSALERMGFDFVIMIDFTPEVAATKGEFFLSELRKYCGLSYLVEGEDFRMGDGGKTGKAEIEAFCKKEGIEAFFIPPVLFEGSRVSSTMIRRMIREGQEESARSLLSF